MSTRNISLGVKAAGGYGWQPYHLHVLNVLKSGSLNLLEPSGTVQAWNGIDLPDDIVIHNSQFIRSISCISSYTFRLYQTTPHDTNIIAPAEDINLQPFKRQV